MAGGTGASAPTKARATRQGAKKRTTSKITGTEQTRARRKVAKTADSTAAMAALIQKHGGPLQLNKATYLEGTVLAHRMMKKLSRWVTTMKPDELTPEQKVGLIGLMPKFITSMEKVGDAIRDRMRELEAASIPPEPPRESLPSVPVSDGNVPVEGKDAGIVPVEQKPVPLDGELIPPSPMDRAFDHPELRKILESGQRLIEEAKADRRRQMEEARRSKA